MKPTRTERESVKSVIKIKLIGCVRRTPSQQLKAIIVTNSTITATIKSHKLLCIYSFTPSCKQNSRTKPNVTINWI